MIDKVAIIHDWLITYRGGEKVLDTILEMYPNADIFSLIAFPGQIPDRIMKRVKGVSFIQRLPYAKKIYRHYLPLMPMAIETFDLSEYKLVISSSHTVAKGVLIHPGTIHISYIYTPMRYIWDRYWDYFGKGAGLKRSLMDFIFSYLRIWDRVSAQRVDYYVAISNIVKERIKKYYNRDSKVIFPPVETEKYLPEKNIKKENYYFILSAFVPYKKIGLAIKAFIKNGKKLIVAGSGPEEKKLKKIAKGYDNIKFIIQPNDDMVKELYQKAIGFIFPGFEDFGMTMVEANSSGTPLIAYRNGGALDIVQEGINGIFFSDQTVPSLNRALEKFEKMDWNYVNIIKSSKRFCKERFKEEFKRFIDEKIQHIR